MLKPGGAWGLLWERTEVRGDCWVWTGATVPKGYGQVRIVRGGPPVYVHRLAHEVFIGPIPEGFQVDHVHARGCRHTACWNPDHLEAVPPGVNNARSSSLTALNARKDECLRGHAFTPENTRVVIRRGREGRACIACERIREAARPPRKRSSRPC